MMPLTGLSARSRGSLAGGKYAAAFAAGIADDHRKGRLRSLVSGLRYSALMFILFISASSSDETGAGWWQAVERGSSGIRPVHSGIAAPAAVRGFGRTFPCAQQSPLPGNHSPAWLFGLGVEYLEIRLRSDVERIGK
jgi:hypothetical protein